MWKPGEKAPERVVSLLPIYEKKREILYCVSKYQTVIIEGPTGCGKTTQLPQYLFRAGYAQTDQIIAVTQPRRIAAISIAKRVAEEMGEELGITVGYSVKFEEKFDPENTKIKFVTDGTLFREALYDPLLSKYSVIIVDEIHERTIHTDLLCALLKKITKKRNNDLKIVISSATIDSKLFQEYFDYNSFFYRIPGKMYPIDIFHLQNPSVSYIDDSINTILKIHKGNPPGDILVFLTGKDDIKKTFDILQSKITLLSVDRLQMYPLKLHASLPLDEQQKVFYPSPRGTRKIIISTNVAETSITIEGIVYVVDCGLEKTKVFDPLTGIESLITTYESRSSAIQRAGRAGRTRSGKVYRLFTQNHFEHKMRKDPIPEIQRCDLTFILLQLKALGITKITDFEFLSKPSVESFSKALENLYYLGAMDMNGDLTANCGKLMAEFPVDSFISKILLTSKQYGCGNQIVTIAAMLSVENVFNISTSEQNRLSFAVEEGDHLTLLNIYNSLVKSGFSLKWCQRYGINPTVVAKVAYIRNQLCKFMKKFNIPMDSTPSSEKILKCVLCGFFMKCAHFSNELDGSYKLLGTKKELRLFIHPFSSLFRSTPDCIIYSSIITTTKPFMENVSVIEQEWLYEVAPQYFRT